MSLHLTPSRARTGRTFVRSRLAAAAALALAAGGVQAMEIETPDPDLSIRWDNTARVNLGVRVEGRDSKIGNTAIADEGTYSFDKGDFVAKRIDWLSELDVVYKKQYGARISGTGWYDAAYGDKSHSNPNPPLVNIPSYIGNEYSGTTKRLYHGGTGELLDAFVFGRIDLGDVPVQAKLGRHTVYWGESVLLGGNLHGIAYSQNPLDLQKGFATPGTEAKELFRPLNQLSVQAQLTDTLSVAAQGMLEWEAARYPEGGTYLGPVDFVFNGPDRQFLSPGLGFATRGAASEPKNTGEWGLSARWAPEWLDGTMGLYYRKFADKLPQVLLTQACAAGSTTATPACADPTLGSRYNLVYADNIDLLGVSLGKNIAGVSVGAEFSYRHNTPLFSQVLGVAPGLPAEGDTKGARGNTIHAVVNALGTVAKTPVFDQATWLAEAHLRALDQRDQRRQPVQRRRLRALPGQRHQPHPRLRQVGRLRHPGLRRHRRRLHADLVPGPSRRRPVGAAHLRGRPLRQLADGVRRQPGPGQLHARRLGRLAAEVSLRPQVHRLRRPHPRQRHRRHVAERPHRLPEGSWLRQPDLPHHLLIGEQTCTLNTSCWRP